MYSSNLYPPIFEQSYMPAFVYNEVCKIYFSLSEYNSLTSLHHLNDIIDGIQVSVRNQKTNESVLNKTLYPSEIKLTTLNTDDNGNYYIEISNSDIQNGFNLNEYYKVQIRLTEKQADTVPVSSAGIDTWLNNNLIYFSEWSRVVLIRGISRPILTLTSLNISNGQASLHTTDLDIIGYVSFENQNDDQILQSYIIQLYNEQGKLIQSSNSIISIDNQINYSLKTNLQVEKTYLVKIQIQTINLYSWDEPYTIECEVVDDEEASINMSVDYIVNNSIGNIKFIFTNGTYNSQHSIKNGDILKIKRTSSKDNFSLWQNLFSYQVSTALSTIFWTDFTVEPGVWYKYNIIKYNSNNERDSSFQIDEPFMVDGEDIYLNADNKQLTIRFNPQINSFSIKTAESTTETIGSQYPYIRQNGEIKYKTFSLSGTITHFMDIGYNLLNASKNDLYKDAKGLYDAYNDINNINGFNDYIYEKDFREKVIDFLCKNNVKLFRSLAEGNILVKLTNISLSPVQSLGRQIYSFSCTASEIAKCNGQNYKKYNILTDDSFQIERMN